MAALVLPMMVMTSCKKEDNGLKFTDEERAVLQVLNGTFVEVKSYGTPEKLVFSPFNNPTEKKCWPDDKLIMTFHGTLHIIDNYNNFKYYFCITPSKTSSIKGELLLAQVLDDKPDYCSSVIGKTLCYTISDNNTISMYDKKSGMFSTRNYKRQ